MAIVNQNNPFGTTSGVVHSNAPGNTPSTAPDVYSTGVVNPPISNSPNNAGINKFDYSGFDSFGNNPDSGLSDGNPLKQLITPNNTAGSYSPNNPLSQLVTPNNTTGSFSPNNPVNQLVTPTNTAGSFSPSNPVNQLTSQSNAPAIQRPAYSTTVPTNNTRNPAFQAGSAPIAPLTSAQQITTPNYSPKPGSSAQSNPFMPLSFQSNPTVTDPVNGTVGINQKQFATPGSAEWLANMLGVGYFQGQQVTGPAGSQNQGAEMLGSQNGPNINAGLAADIWNRYGAANPEYAKYLIMRDLQPGGTQQPDYSQWVQQNGTVNPATSSPTQSQPLPQNTYLQGSQPPPQNNTNDFMSSINAILQLLGSLGIVSNGQGYQRPPALTPNNTNSAYWSKFA